MRDDNHTEGAKQKRRTLDQRRLMYLADRLAIALCYLEAIEDSVDPFADEHDEEAWDVCMLIAKARAEIMDGHFASDLAVETGPLIERVRNQQKIGVLRDTPLYDEAMKIVRRMTRKVQ